MKLGWTPQLVQQSPGRQILYNSADEKSYRVEKHNVHVFLSTATAEEAEDTTASSVGII